MGNLTTVGALLIAILAHTAYKSYIAPPHVPSPYEHFFSESYYDARALFRDSARAANAKLHAIPYPIESMDLTIDVAILPGTSPSSLVIHLSGMHGVEGFAGGAIQSALLSNASFTSAAHVPTIVFVHAVNPFGFAKLRRFNEHNVDLNRNHLTPEEFTAARARDPNHAGYEDISHLLNPPEHNDMAFWLGSVYSVLTRGFLAVKRAIVAGTYHNPRGIFYGGHELEPSHRLLHAFFAAQFDLATITRVAFVDVHTGLGPTGAATIRTNKPDLAPLLFPGCLLASADDGALAGYEDVQGSGVQGYKATWFQTASTVVTVTQEFGTVSSSAVVRGVIIESAAFNHHPESRLAAAELVRDVFYLHDDPQWKHAVANQGIDGLQNIVAHWSELFDGQVV
ncbi:Aste57867_19035 [Aphanomyces stellatus]|uniref:Aste57867_19035 protein n=1 Tax=Aphanomyces stellatus TaxID=120398 RepID=A0A485LDA5_9STRA|nr:hypothetical protein As57867_018971 [Aphanomyces stellatus]VFT95760.1 Aste57867_19035 [Aphanomyces stellatus]